MDTLLARLNWILQARDISERQLALQAGLSHASVSTMRRALERDPGAAARVELGTLDKIATAAGVDATWLKTGAGVPDLGQQPPAPPDADASGGDASRAARFKNFVNWPALLRAARAMKPALPEWVWLLVADSAPMTSGPPTALMVAEFAEFLSRHESAPPSR